MTPCRARCLAKHILSYPCRRRLIFQGVTTLLHGPADGARQQQKAGTGEKNAVAGAGHVKEPAGEIRARRPADPMAQKHAPHGGTPPGMVA